MPVNVMFLQLIRLPSSRTPSQPNYPQTSPDTIALALAMLLRPYKEESVCLPKGVGVVDIHVRVLREEPSD